MPTQTHFLCPSGGSNVDLSGIFEPLNGGTAYGSATNYKVGSSDFNTLFHASTSTDDRPSFNTGFKLSGGTDLSTVFRRYGFVGITITSQPTNQVVNNNATATFSITATAAGTPTYQWYGPSGLISGATSTSYTTGSLTTANDSDSYYCKVSYGGSSVNSNTVSSKIKPYITSQPSNLNVDDNTGPYAFQVSADGSGTIYYQWYKGATALGTSFQHVINPALSSDIGNYYCKVTSNYDSTGVNSNTVSLSLIAPIVSTSLNGGYSAPFIFNYGDSLQINSSVSQGTNISYQWYKNGSLIYGATSANYSFVLSETTFGSYHVVATNGGGSYSTSSSPIVIYMTPYVFSSPNSTTVNVGENASFTATVYGSPTIYYDWYKNGSLVVSNSTSNTFVDIDMSLSDDGNSYYCIAKWTYGGTTYTDTSSIAYLTVIE